LLYESPSIQDIQTDFMQTLKQCELITLRKARRLSVFGYLYRSILRLFAPLM